MTGLAERADRADVADQAHLTNEFRQLPGAAPRASCPRTVSVPN
jgi:hypothetical protein